MPTPATVKSPRSRSSAILNDPEVREFFALLDIARSQVATRPDVIDKERCARAMVDAYYQGQLDRERIAREVESVYVRQPADPFRADVLRGERGTHEGEWAVVDA